MAGPLPDELWECVADFLHASRLPRVCRHLASLLADRPQAPFSHPEWPTFLDFRSAIG